MRLLVTFFVNFASRRGYNATPLKNIKSKTLILKYLQARMNEKVIIFSAPSGAGKSTIVQNILKHYPGQFEFSISATSRNPRGSEKNGVDYYFLSAEQFRELIDKNAFVEHEEVYHDKFYGTLKSEVERIWADGKIIIFDVDVKGGYNLKKYFGDKARSFLIVPPSMEILEKRLRGRGTDSEEDIHTRLDKAQSELAFAHGKFDVEIVNNDLNTALSHTYSQIDKFLCE